MEKQKPQGNGKIIGGAILALAFALTAVVLYIMGPTHMPQSMLLYLCLPVLVIGVLAMVFNKPVFGVMLLLFGVAGLVAKELINLSTAVLRTGDLGTFACYAIIIIGALLGILFEIIRSNRMKVKALRAEMKNVERAAKESEKAAAAPAVLTASNAEAPQAPERPFASLLGLGKNKSSENPSEPEPAKEPEIKPEESAK